VVLTAWRKKRRLDEQAKQLGEMSSLLWESPNTASQQGNLAPNFESLWLHEGTRRALESVVDELRAKVKGELEENSSKFIEQTRQRLQDEVSKAVAAFCQEAQRTIGEKIVPAIQAEVENSLRRSAENILSSFTKSVEQRAQNACQTAVDRVAGSNSTAAGEAVGRADGARLQDEVPRAADEFSRDTRRKMAEKVAPSIQAEIENSLRKSAAELLGSFTESIEQQAQNACRTAVDRAVESINLAAAEAAARVDGMRQENVPDRGPGRELEPDKASGHSNTALEELKSKSDALLGNLQTQLQETVEQLSRKDVQKALGQIHTTTEQLLQNSGRQLQEVADSTLKTTVDKLNSFAKRLVEQSMEQQFDDSRKYENRRPSAEADIHTVVAMPHPIARPGSLPYKPAVAKRFNLEPQMPRFRVRVAESSLARLSRVCLWAAAFAVPVFLVICLAIHPVMRLRADPPAEFFGVSPGWDAKRRLDEERLARAYWDKAVHSIQWKYKFGTNLPDEPVSEFALGGRKPDAAASKPDIDSRVVYWRRLQRVWLLPQAWQKSYEWNIEEGWGQVTTNKSLPKQ
jgi:hypothetical protein